MGNPRLSGIEMCRGPGCGFTFTTASGSSQHEWLYYCRVAAANTRVVLLSSVLFWDGYLDTGGIFVRFEISRYENLSPKLSVVWFAMIMASIGTLYPSPQTISISFLISSLPGGLRTVSLKSSCRILWVIFQA